MDTMVKGRLNALLVTLSVAFLLAFFNTLLISELNRDEHEKYEVHLQEHARLNYDKVVEVFSDLEASLAAISAFVALTPEMTRYEFDRFTSQQSISNFGIATYEWIPKVESQDQAKTIAIAKSNGQFDFSIRPLSATAYLTEHFPILFNSSAQMNGLSLGLDFSTQQEIAAAIKSGADTGYMQLAMIDSLDEELVGPELRLLKPVYVDKSPEKNYQSLTGVVSAMFHLETAIPALLGEQFARTSKYALQLSYLDGDNKTLLYSSHRAASLIGVDSHKTWTIEAKIASKPIQLIFFDLEVHSFNLLDQKSLLVISLILFSVLLLIYVYRSLVSRGIDKAVILEQNVSLKAKEEQYLNLFYKVVEGVFSATVDGKFDQINPALARTFGYISSEKMLAELEGNKSLLYVDSNVYQNFVTQLLKHGEVNDFEWQGVTRDGKHIWLSENAYLTKEGGNYEGTLSEITDRKNAENRLKYQAKHDALTQCVNRAYFMQSVEQLLHQQPVAGAVLFIDLDKFKQVNDSFGHQVGDNLLVEFARRIQSCLRGSDILARLGGDEFAVLVSGIKDMPQILSLTRRIEQEITQSYMVENADKLQITASIGINLLTENYNDAQSVVRDADMAMYEVKQSGRGAHLAFNQDISRKVQHQNQLELQLRSALKNKGFYLVYQAVCRLSTGEVKGYEALLRWNNPVLGLVSPVDFIPTLENSGLINQVGDWILRQAIVQLKIFQELHGNPELTMNINLSPRQLEGRDLVHDLKRLLNKSRISANTVNLELTESAMENNEARAIAQLNELKQLGFGIVIDDFGTGHSSLKRLVDYPATGLKIDRSFVSNVQDNENIQIIIKSLLMMAEVYKLELVAEGIESMEELQWLKQQGCTLGQGYYFAKPATAKVLIKALTNGLAKPGLEKDISAKPCLI